jgi:Domain of unknown function (DUF4167)
MVTMKSFRTRQRRPLPSSGGFKGPMLRSNAATGPANIRTSYERYMALARAAVLAGDAVEAENYHQHAEHYFRLMRELERS